MKSPAPGSGRGNLMNGMSIVVPERKRRVCLRQPSCHFTVILQNPSFPRGRRCLAARKNRRFCKIPAQSAPALLPTVSSEFAETSKEDPLYEYPTAETAIRLSWEAARASVDRPGKWVYRTEHVPAAFFIAHGAGSGALRPDRPGKPLLRPAPDPSRMGAVASRPVRHGPAHLVRPGNSLGSSLGHLPHDRPSHDLFFPGSGARHPAHGRAQGRRYGAGLGALGQQLCRGAGHAHPAAGRGHGHRPLCGLRQ